MMWRSEIEVTSVETSPKGPHLANGPVCTLTKSIYSSAIGLPSAIMALAMRRPVFWSRPLEVEPTASEPALSA